MRRGWVQETRWQIGRLFEECFWSTQKQQTEKGKFQIFVFDKSIYRNFIALKSHNNIFFRKRHFWLYIKIKKKTRRRRGRGKSSVYYPHIVIRLEVQTTSTLWSSNPKQKIFLISWNKHLWLKSTSETSGQLTTLPHTAWKSLAYCATRSTDENHADCLKAFFVCAQRGRGASQTWTFAKIGKPHAMEWSI